MSAAVRRGLLAVLYFAAAAVALAFLALPTLAIFLRVPPGKLVAQLSNPVVTDALIVSLKTTLIAQVLILLLGTPLAYLVASRRFRGRSLLVTLIELPLARSGLAAGEALAFARGLGEFGATIMFAGSLQGVTQTLPLAIYSAFDVNFDVALAMGALLVAISAALLLSLRLILSWQPSRQTSRSLFAPLS